VNYAGLALLLLGIGMLVAEFFVSSSARSHRRPRRLHLRLDHPVEPGAPGYQLALLSS